mmetsp:Transcript_40725/g.107906  ORF Transcript_40725/g.107906 Transcript_40725/m.107906 type:complete len:244 (-) Transcript_40725:439-1170(-)
MPRDLPHHKHVAVRTACSGLVVKRVYLGLHCITDRSLEAPRRHEPLNSSGGEESQLPLPWGPRDAGVCLICLVDAGEDGAVIHLRLSRVVAVVLPVVPDAEGDAAHVVDEPLPDQPARLRAERHHLADASALARALDRHVAAASSPTPLAADEGGLDLLGRDHVPHQRPQLLVILVHALGALLPVGVHGDAVQPLQGARGPNALEPVKIHSRGGGADQDLSRDLLVRADRPAEPVQQVGVPDD